MALIRFTEVKRDPASGRLDITERIVLEYDENGEPSRYLDLDPDGKQPAVEVTEEEHLELLERYEGRFVFEEFDTPAPEAQAGENPLVDPASFSVEEVLDAFEDATEGEVLQAIELERSGKDRKGITSFELPEPEDGDEADDETDDGVIADEN